MSAESGSSQRGRLKIGDTSTVDIQPSVKPHRVLLERDPVLGLLSLEDRFIDQGEIARGGMGAIHRVIERTLNRTVAMKVLQSERAHERLVRQRFLAEAQVTGQLDHPNIVPVYELGSDDDGKMFFTMQLIEGRTFSEFLDSNPPDNDERVEQALEVFFRVCDAISFAHSRGVVHRDVKPSNIMVGEFGQVYLMDWGIARVLPEADVQAATGERRRTTTLTIPAVDERGQVLGTYAYMAPEQARGALDEIDARTDVFGLGAVLFRIVAGRPPISGKTTADQIDNASEARLVDVSEEVKDALRRALLEVAGQAMQKDRTRRFQNAAGLKRAAQHVLRGRFRFSSLKVDAGSLILREGESGDDAYYIRSGSCRVFSKRDGVEVELTTLGPGEVFGETAIFTGQPRNASVQAHSAVELIVVPGRFLAGTVGLDSWMGSFVRALGERFTHGSHKVAELERELISAELATQACRLLALEGERGADGVVRVDFEKLRELAIERWGLDEVRLVDLLTRQSLDVEADAGRRRVVLRAG
ncbi:MAG TPA: protein kinase [Myxococcota bacterium]|nr:protein kinase [Myxococcota bacterium]